ncbi:MAG: YARHG domain-containing protein [Acidobacteriota bacterium]
MNQDDAAASSQDERGTNSRNRFLVFAGAGVAGLLIIIIAIVAGFLYRRYRAQTTVSTNSSPSQSGPVVSERAQQIESKILRGETLSNADLNGLSAYELRVLRNVHFARYGRKYDQNGELGSYFYTRPWYKPNESYSDGAITASDKANITLILLFERASAPATASSTPPPVQEQPSAPVPDCSSRLTNACAQRAIQRAINSGRFSGNVTVKGVLEAGNEARADIRMYVMEEGKARPFDGDAVATFVRYNDGRGEADLF